MAQTATWTIGQLLQWTTDYLREHGAESPRLDAEVLLAHARGCQRIELYTCFTEIADEGLRETFRALVKQRAAGAPVAYLVGRKEFYSKSFIVTSDVLIPRPETEFVLLSLFDSARAQGQTAQNVRIVDVGTGSGVLAICAALELPAAQITAIDVSPAALDIARRNAAAHGVESRIRFVESDLFHELDEGMEFDYIVANPPYIGLQKASSLPRDVIAFEPHVALFSGQEGLDTLDRLIATSAQRLVPGGWLFSEFNPAQQPAIRQLAARHAEWETPRFRDDLTRRPRVVEIQRRP